MAGQGSARVTLREIDLSQVRNPQQLPQGVPAAVVGPARKGPAFVPRTFANMQQFNEVFGNMLEVGRESNSNQFGPLALNEWMKSARAGTYIRVLGVGDGKASLGGRVSDAGFIVGDRLVQDTTGGDVSKVDDNQDATITGSTAALELGRTHFLGCFMKDESGSTYLQDAGVQVDESSAELKIKFDATTLPSNDSYIELLSVDADGNTTSKKYGFKTGGGAIDDDDGNEVVPAAQVINTSVATTGQLIVDALVILINGADGHNGGLVAIENPEVAEEIIITQSVAGLAGNSAVDSRITASARDKITITGSTTITNSTEQANGIKFREGTDGTKSTATIAVKAGDVNATEGDTLAIQSILVDGTVAGAGASTVTVTFQDIGSGAVGYTEAEKAAGYKVANGSTVNVITGDSGDNSLDGQKGTLANLTAALNDSTLTNTYDNGLRASLSADGLTVTITQGFAGTEGDVATIVENVEADAFNIQAQATADGGAGLTFSGGAVATASSITLAFTGQPNVGDLLELPSINAGTAEEFIIVSESAAAVNGSLLDASKVQVELGASLDITLNNFKDAILTGSGTLNSGHVDVVIDVLENTLTISSGAAALSNNLNVPKFNMSSNVTISNPAGDSLVGNFGAKTTSFTGGQFNEAKPVIRGVLMTPQGVRAALDVNSGVAGLVDAASASLAQIRSVAHGKQFGDTAGTHLTGYVVGEVDSNQGFKLILNGYSNTENPAVLHCSFDPNSSTYFKKVLNTDPTKIEELGHYLYAYWDVDPTVAKPSNQGLRKNGAQITNSYENMVGFLLAGEGDGVNKRNSSASGKPNYEDFSNRFATAKTPWIVSQFYGAGENTAARPMTALEGQALKLFRLYALDDGEISNHQFRLLISNLRYGGKNDFGSFDMSLETLESDPIKGSVLAAWKNANLDASSRNFIGRLIGDKNIYYDFERDVNNQRLREEGQYARKNSYVRIELSDALKQGQIPVDALPTGFQGHSHLFTKSDGNFLELDIADANKIFTASGTVPSETLSQAQVAPMDFVSSINRALTSTDFQADDDLAWGVKFAKRENSTSVNKELSELVFNHSVKSWSKFFPSIGSNPAWITDADEADLNQNSFFSLEKILIPKESIVDNKISTWDGAIYKRASYTPSDGDERFVTISEDALGRNAKFLKFRCMFQGGFDGVNIFDTEKSELSGVASLREGEDETNTQKFTGPTIMSYQRAIDVLSDKSATEFQLLAIPGQRTPRITDYAIDACEERFDALYLFDIVEKDSLGDLIEYSTQNPHVRNTISLFSSRILDTSFAAAYFPDVVIRRPSDDAPLVVPPSVGMLGVMSRNDSIADPWFAPAGLNRGKLPAIDSRVQMNRDLLDELYDADINPIYVPAGRQGEVYAFGQKTLLQDASALDRINVRRLLIDIRRKVKKVGEKLLFEPNRSSTLSRFASLVEPIMANVQERRGVTRYKVQIDSSTTTQNDIENNTIRGKIYLQPTKSVEFISLDFVVTNTIQQ